MIEAQKMLDEKMKVVRSHKSSKNDDVYEGMIDTSSRKALKAPKKRPPIVRDELYQVSEKNSLNNDEYSFDGDGDYDSEISEMS